MPVKVKVGGRKATFQVSNKEDLDEVIKYIEAKMTILEKAGAL